MPLLRRPHDHRRVLRAWRCTPRPAVVPSRGQDCDAKRRGSRRSLPIPPGSARHGLRAGGLSGSFPRKAGRYGGRNRRRSGHSQALGSHSKCRRSSSAASWAEIWSG
jgi:hypothetical protein